MHGYCLNWENGGLLSLEVFTETAKSDTFFFSFLSHLYAHSRGRWTQTEVILITLQRFFFVLLVVDRAFLALRFPLI